MILTSQFLIISNRHEHSFHVFRQRWSDLYVPSDVFVEFSNQNLKPWFQGGHTYRRITKNLCLLSGHSGCRSGIQLHIASTGARLFPSMTDGEKTKQCS